ncbi:MAG: cation transporter [Bacteroidetes bacterium]|nr:cation transporter [Bacteroidota bacterium]
MTIHHNTKHSQGLNSQKGSTDHSHTFETKTLIVVIITAVTMVAEIFFGYWTNSMALLADGWHMASHVLALGLSWIAYVFARKYANSKKYSFSKEKLLSLSGFASAIFLLVVAVFMAIQSVERLISPVSIKFGEAIIVAVIGLIVNVLSAFILHHKYEHSDHNIRSAYLHVLADGLTSFTAIIALTAGMYYNLFYLDSLSGIISSVVITKWAIELIKNSGRTLIEFNKK